MKKYLLIPGILVAFQNIAFAEKFEKASFAGGCFWCVEAQFEKYDGIKSVVSGYTGGHVKNPKYKQVSSGTTGHVEAVQIIYDPKKISYEDLLEIFWRSINPTDDLGQFVDRGEQYRPIIFYHTEEQKLAAEKSIKKLKETKLFKKKITIPIIKATPFYVAEDYHQDYYKRNPIRYKFYRYRSGRDQFLEKVWGEDLKYKPKVMGMKIDSKKMKTKDMEVESRDAKRDSIKTKQKKMGVKTMSDAKTFFDRIKKLSKLEYKVTQKNDTEPAFKNQYWDNTKHGIYVDIVSGEPLFSSTDKFKSGTGWPSFTKPLLDDNIVEKSDNSFFMKRTEVRSKHANSHLGHVFKDGPAPTGLRYCINSTALKFVPANELEAKGYGEYKGLFNKVK